MKLLVGGGSGFIGKHLRTLAERKGYEMVNVARRSVDPNDLTWASLERYGLPSGVDSVINLSGKNIMTPGRWTSELKQSLIDSRVETSKILVDVVNSAETKPPSFIAISAIGYYGSQDSDTDVTEESPPGADFFSKLCQQWEQSVSLDDNDIRKVTVRIGLAIGSDGGMISSMYWPFFFGLGGNIGDGKQWFPWIHVDDVAGIIMHAIEKKEVNGVLNAVAPQTATNADFTTAMSNSMRRYAPFPVPKCVLSTLLGDERAEVMTSSPKILPTQTLNSGYQYKHTDLQSACNSCVQWG